MSMARSAFSVGVVFNIENITEYIDRPKTSKSSPSSIDDAVSKDESKIDKMDDESDIEDNYVETD